MKPMLFNTEMVRAIMAGRKTVTRRAVKLKYSNTHLEMRTDKYGTRLIELQNEEPGVTTIRNQDGTTTHKLLAAIERTPPYRPGDILYVRETWAFIPCIDCQAGENCNMTPVAYEDRYMVGEGCFVYRADYPTTDRICWNPSIHMPREAARIFLRVTDVRVERLQDIFKDPPGPNSQIVREGFAYGCDFIAAWQNMTKKADLARYGLDADPWVWVIEFERITKEEAET